MKLITLTEVARILGMSYPRAKIAFEKGQLPDPVMLGEKPRFRESEIRAIIEGEKDVDKEG